MSRKKKTTDEAGANVGEELGKAAAASAKVLKFPQVRELPCAISAAELPAMSSALTGSTSTWRSMRSSNGPLMRAR